MTDNKTCSVDILSVSLGEEGYLIIPRQTRELCEPLVKAADALPTVSLLCTPYALREEKNQRIFVYIKCSAIQTTFLARKYGLQAADFRDDAVWGVIWLADK